MTYNWQEVIESDWKTKLRLAKDRWVHEPDEDKVDGIILAVGREVLTDARLSRIHTSELLTLPTPGGMGDTMGDVIRDSIIEYLEPAVSAWVEAQWEPPSVDEA